MRPPKRNFATAPSAIFGGVTLLMFRVKENIPLSKWSSYRIGGPARYFFEARTVDEIKEALRWAKEKRQPVFILGGGTNLLIDDRGFAGLVLKPNLETLETQSETVFAGAGILISDLLDFTIKKGLSGLEWAGGLPGTVGGAIRGNAGAFGGEIKDVVHSVVSLDTKSFVEIVRNKLECQFGYRSSIFKEKGGDEMILGVTLTLWENDSNKIRQAIQEKIDYRLARHPMEYPNIGSIFKNVDVKKVPKKHLPELEAVIKVDPFPVVPTAYLISEAGLKGVSYGGAMVSPKHPNFIVNVFDAKADEVRSLIELVRAKVRAKFSIDVEQEVQLV